MDRTTASHIAALVARPAADPQDTGSSPQAVDTESFWEPHCGLQCTFLVHVHRPNAHASGLISVVATDRGQ